MDLKKLKVDWKRVLITSAIVMLSALVVGGTTWYVMDKSSREVAEANDASVATLQEQISTMEAASATEKAALTEKVETTVEEPVANGVSTLETYCTTANDGVLLPGYSYMKNANGEFANCGLGEPDVGGAMLIAKFVNGAWTKLWSGNGVIEVSVCDADKIPNKMSGGTCNY